MISNIKIVGQIGTTHKPDGEIDVKGVELEDVINDFEKVKHSEIVNVWINSNGGVVNTGKEIAKYLSSFSNVVTIADEMCMSIATQIHLCVSLEKRKITEGCVYMIHSPLLTDFNGSSDDFIQAGKYLKPIEKEMTSMYVKATGLSEQAIVGMLKKETLLNSEQVISMGFASEVVKKPFNMKALAFVNLENIKKNKMNKEKSLLSRILAFAGLEENKGREAVAVSFNVEEGTLETPFSDLMVGDPVLLNGEQAPAGTYNLEDGSKLVVNDDGNIAEIIPASSEMEQLIVALQNENEELKQKISDFEAEKTAIEEALAKAEEKSKLEKSSYKPVVSQGFSKQKPAEKTAYEQMLDRKKDYKQNK